MFKKAVKEQSKLRLAVDGLAGAGKTFTILKVATEMAKLMREAKMGEGRIALIDSERGSASLYADKFDFDVSELDSFSPLAYVEAIHEAERLGYDFILADSISHAWAGKDGALDQKDRAADRGGNSWTAWRNVTPKHNALVDAMLQCKAHFMATMRVKMEHVQETVNGKTEIKKVGLASIQREGMDYEFTIVGDIDHSHTMKISKSRLDGVVSVGEQFEKPGEVFARRVWGWLISGAAPSPRVAPQQQQDAVSDEIDKAFADYLASFSQAKTLPELDRIVAGPNRPAKGTRNYQLAAERYSACKREIQQAASEPQSPSEAGAA